MQASSMTSSPDFSAPPIAVSAPYRAAMHLVARYRRHRQYIRGLRELQACSSRDLKDLGIYRGDIRRLARDAVSG